MNEKSDILESEIRFELDKQRLNIPIPPEPPFIAWSLGFVIRMCFAVCVLCMSAYYSLWEGWLVPPEFNPQNTTWVYRYWRWGDDVTYYMLWDFDGSNELRVVHIWEDGSYLEETYTYTLVGKHGIRFKGDGLLNGKTTIQMEGSNLNIDVGDGGYGGCGEPQARRYPRDKNEKMWYLQNLYEQQVVPDIKAKGDRLP